MLSKFPNKTLKVGAVVSLSPEHRYSRYESNPIGMRGVVANNGENWGGSLLVVWDNGDENVYSRTDYDLIAEGEPGFLSTI